MEPCAECGGALHPKWEWLDDCPKSYGTDRKGIHNAYTTLGDKLGVDRNADAPFGKVEDYAAERWPTVCEACGAAVPTDLAPANAAGEIGIYLHRQVFVERLYDSPSGHPEPGDVFLTQWHDPGQCHYWDNCDGVHTIGILPNGHRWDIDSRASNCDKKDDRAHRCWVKRGRPEDGTLDVGKGDDPAKTCTAGAGSILVEGWHGYLRNFTWEG